MPRARAASRHTAPATPLPAPSIEDHARHIFAIAQAALDAGEITRLDQVRGMEHTKRMIEIAAVGGHQTCIVPRKIDTTDRHAPLHARARDLGIQYMLAAHRTVFPTAPAIIIAAVALPPGSGLRVEDGTRLPDIMLPPPPEPDEEILARITAATPLRSQEYPVEPGAADLLSRAAERCGLNADGQAAVIDIARSIAALDRRYSISRAHIAEALYYQINFTR